MANTSACRNLKTSKTCFQTRRNPYGEQEEQPGRAKEGQGKPGAWSNQGEPGEAKESQGHALSRTTWESREPGGARESYREPGGASHEQPKGAKESLGSQEEPGGAPASPWLLLIPPGSF
jgi:hypothetical protein